MSKEIREIVHAYKLAKAEGRQTALATVVQVEGSSYRRPGARMLVEDNGRLTGAISGGCLEGDALRKALHTINLGKNKLVTYNTMLEDDAEFGIQLGCNGIVHILFEPVNATEENNPITLLERSLIFPGESVLVTLFSIQNSQAPQPGTCLLLNTDQCSSAITDEGLKTQISTDAATVLQDGSSLIKEYPEQFLSALFELLLPPVSLVIIGAGNDALPLVQMAHVLGWNITVADGRSTHATAQRFPSAKDIFTGKPTDIMTRLVIDERTAIVLMSHNYKYDLEMLGLLIQHPCRYIGTLGPKKRLERMLNELQENGISVTEKQRAIIYGPTGLDIGAETSEEISLSVLAEVKAVFADRNGLSLRGRSESIHHRHELQFKNREQHER